MKNFPTKICSESQFWTMFMLLSLVIADRPCETTEQDATSQYFVQKFDGTARLNENIISESSEHSWLHCGTSCLATRFCAAYNYKESLGESEINCQLSHSVDNNFKMISYNEENDWMFYIIDGPRLLACEQENECQNGGTMVWDPVKPFKCECPKNYDGEFCETFAVGARVFARWTNGLYYRGFISQTTHLTVSINYDSGLKITLSKNDETAVVLDKIPSDGEVTIGQRVIGYWPNRVRFYPGYISKLCDNGKKYYFIFDDGDERCQDISEMRTF